MREGGEKELPEKVNHAKDVCTIHQHKKPILATLFASASLVPFPKRVEEQHDVMINGPYCGNSKRELIIPFNEEMLLESTSYELVPLNLNLNHHHNNKHLGNKEDAGPESCIDDCQCSPTTWRFKSHLKPKTKIWS